MRRPFLFIFLTTVLISGTAWGLWGRTNGGATLNVTMPAIPCGQSCQGLLDPSSLLPAIIAEWLDLSLTRDRNLYRLNLEQARAKLESQPPVKRGASFPPASFDSRGGCGVAAPHCAHRGQDEHGDFRRGGSLPADSHLYPQKTSSSFHGGKG